MKEQIELLQDELNRLLNDDSVINQGEILMLSEKLDKLIYFFYSGSSFTNTLCYSV